MLLNTRCTVHAAESATSFILRYAGGTGSTSLKCMLSIVLSPVSNQCRQPSKLTYVHVNNGNQNMSKQFQDLKHMASVSVSNMPMLWFAAVQGNHIRRLTDRAVWSSQGRVTTLDSNNLSSWVLCIHHMTMSTSWTALRCTIAGLAVGISLLALYETYRERWEENRLNMENVWECPSLTFRNL